MGRSLVAHQPVATAFLNSASSNIPAASSWVELEDSLPYAASGALFHNTSAQGVLVGRGAAAAEVGFMYVPPTSNTGVVPVRIPKGTRIALQSAETTISSGTFAATFFG